MTPTSTTDLFFLIISKISGWIKMKLLNTCKFSEFPILQKHKPKTFQSVLLKIWKRVTVINAPFFHTELRFCPWAEMFFPIFFLAKQIYFYHTILVLIDLHQTPIISREKYFSWRLFTLKGLRLKQNKNLTKIVGSKEFVPNGNLVRTNFHFQVLIFWNISLFISAYSSVEQMMVLITC